jgi:hypothetical protein
MAALVWRALAGAECRTRMVGRDVWELALRRQFAVRGWIAGEWLVLEAAPAPRSLRRLLRGDWPAALLERQRALSGTVKFVLEDGPVCRALRIRAEIPLTDPADGMEPATSDVIAARVRDACAALRAAQHCATATPRHAVTVPADGPIALADLAVLCQEAGWCSVEGTAHELRVALDADVAGFRQAVLTADRGGVRFLLNLRDGMPTVLDAACRRAIALLLLRTGSVVRCIRATLAEASDELGFEVRTAGAPGIGDVGHALASLSLAARISAAEVEALAADARLARAYSSGLLEV